MTPAHPSLAARPATQDASPRPHPQTSRPARPHPRRPPSRRQRPPQDRQHAYRMIDAAAIRAQLEMPPWETNPPPELLPEAERQMRPLTPIRDDPDLVGPPGTPLSRPPMATSGPWRLPSPLGVEDCRTGRDHPRRPCRPPRQPIQRQLSSRPTRRVGFHPTGPAHRRATRARPFADQARHPTRPRPNATRRTSP